ncbi:MAG TPA: M20/M25/M40 family metallo-hydrolase [Streptosporangiaceae bacterium]|nr:M20/M25/M40 family metallo-hydrolase [Streptosporangiaceae bacterium]
MPPTTKQVIDLLGDLIRIESVTPTLVLNGSGEQSIARFIADWLAGIRADVPVEVEIDEVEPGRPNVLARLRGSGGGRTLCLNAHTDTAGYEAWPDDALVPRVVGNRIYGLGASDDKSGCAAAMLALRTVARSGTRLTGDLLVAFVADAEGFSIGSQHLACQGGIDAAIVIEPQPVNYLVVEHQGLGRIDVVTRGVAAHGSAPDAGVDAIVHMAEVITRLHELDRTKFQSNPSLLNGRVVFHTATISGGTNYATYPDFAKLGIEIGTMPGERLSDRVAEIEAIFAEVAKAEPGFDAELEVRLDREPFVARGHEALQTEVVAAMTGVLGSKPVITGMNAWRDAALMQAAGIPTLLMGSTGGNSHTALEWTSISDVIKLSEILSRVAIGYLS